MAENNSRILKWFVWLQNFDFDIVYKPGHLNCLADMLTREQHNSPSLGMFSIGEFSSSNLPSKKINFDSFCEVNEVDHAVRQLQCSTLMSEEERKKYLSIISRAFAEQFMNATLIQAIKESPLRISILEKWEI